MKILVLILAFCHLTLCATKIVPETGLGIINGQEVIPHSKPYQVRLDAVYLTFSQYCSGSLITPKDVITTARCIMGSDYVNMFAGLHDLNKNDGYSVWMKTTEYRIYEKFDYNYDYNVAILKLPETMSFTKYISTIALNLNIGDLQGKMVQISGWGGQTYNDLETSTLMQASAMFVNESVCLSHGFDMPKTDVCLSGVNGATICVADAGGPVVLNGELVALLSPKENDCKRWRSFSAVDLSKFANWIRSNMEPHLTL